MRLPVQICCSAAQVHPTSRHPTALALQAAIDHRGSFHHCSYQKQYMTNFEVHRFSFASQ
jgi:hypothetical protein